MGNAPPPDERRTERRTPLGRALEPLLQVVEGPLGHLGQERQRHVQLLAQHPPEVRRVAPRVEELVEVVEGVVGRYDRHEHPHGRHASRLTRPRAADRAPWTTMRIATFNILSGRSPQDDRVDEGRFAEAIKRLDADLLGLQEVDRNQPRSQHADLTAIAAEAMGAVDHRFVAALSGTPGALVSGDRRGAAGLRGVRRGVPEPLPGHRLAGGAAATRSRPGAPPLARAAAARLGARRAARRRGGRGRHPHGPLRVVTTHLSFLRIWNVRQLRVLLRGIGERPTSRSS